MNPQPNPEQLDLARFHFAELLRRKGIPRDNNLLYPIKEAENLRDQNIQFWDQLKRLDKELPDNIKRNPLAAYSRIETFFNSAIENCTKYNKVLLPYNKNFVVQTWGWLTLAKLYELVCKYPKSVILEEYGDLDDPKSKTRIYYAAAEICASLAQIRLGPCTLSLYLSSAIFESDVCHDLIKSDEIVEKVMKKVASLRTSNRDEYKRLSEDEISGKLLKDLKERERRRLNRIQPASGRYR